MREGHYFVTSWIALRVRACGPRFAEGSLLLTSRERVGVCVKESPAHREPFWASFVFSKMRRDSTTCVRARGPRFAAGSLSVATCRERADV